MLDLPEHPHKRDAQADDDAQKQQRQGRSCEHGEHPQIKANAVPTSGNKAASVQNTPRPRESCRRLKLYLTGPALLPAVKGAAAGSVTNLDRTETPAVARMHAPLHHVAAAIVVVGIVVGIIRIAVVVTVIIIGVVESVA